MEVEQLRQIKPNVDIITVRSDQIVHVKPEIKDGAKQEEINRRNFVFAYGWGKDAIRWYLTAMESMAQICEGHVWSNIPPRSGNGRRLDGDALAHIEMQKAGAMVRLLQYVSASKENAGIKPELVVVAHSEGALYACQATLQSVREDIARVRSVILIEPAGLIGKDNMFQLTRRFVKEVIKNIKLDWRYYIKNRRIGERSRFAPGAFFSEIRAIADANISPIIEELVNNGVNVFVIAGENDGVFPSKRIRQTIEENKLNVEFESHDMRHSAIYAKKTKEVMDIVRRLTSK